MFWPCETRTSTCRRFATISSGLYRFLAIAVLLDVKDIPQVGRLQWGWISPTGRPLELRRPRSAALTDRGSPTSPSSSFALCRELMPTANSSASKEVVTAALLVIGSKILSGRTKDQNIGYVAEYLTAVGIDLKEVRVVGDEERAIVDALNALRHRFTYIFTTGGIGPTHGDITADCVAKAFGVPIDTDPRALAILHEWVKTTGAEMNEARLRLTRIPKGADLILNKVSGAPGFWIGNVIVMAGVHSIMLAMADEVAPKLKIGVRMLSETVRADAREGDIGMQLGEIAKANPEVAIGSYPFFDQQHGAAADQQ